MLTCMLQAALVCQPPASAALWAAVRNGVLIKMQRRCQLCTAAAWHPASPALDPLCSQQQLGTLRAKHCTPCVLLGAVGELPCVVQVAQECKLTVDVEDYVNSFRADLMNATAAWCRGARFSEVLKMSDVFEVGVP